MAPIVKKFLRGMLKQAGEIKRLNLLGMQG
jgi:hypothetical protein